LLYSSISGERKGRTTGMYRGFTPLLNLGKTGITPWEGAVTPVAVRGIDLKAQ